MEQMYVTAREAMQALGVGRGKAYKIIQQLNDELREQGYVVVAGKCSRQYFGEKIYGCESKNQYQRGVD